MIPEISKSGPSLPPATHQGTEKKPVLGTFNTEATQRAAACPQNTETKQVDELFMEIDLSDEPLCARAIATPNINNNIHAQITDSVHSLFGDIPLEGDDFAEVVKNILKEEDLQTLPQLKEGLETLKQSGAITEGTSLEEWATIDLKEPEKRDTKTPLSLSLSKTVGITKRFLLKLSESLFGTSTKAIQHALEEGLRSGIFNDKAIEKWKNNYGGNYEKAMAKALETIKTETENSIKAQHQHLPEALSKTLKSGENNALNSALTTAQALHRENRLYAPGKTTFPVTLKPSDLSASRLEAVFGNTAFLITEMLPHIQNTRTPVTLHIALEGKEPNSHTFVIKAIEQGGETLLEEGSFL